MPTIDSGGVQFAPMVPKIDYGALAGIRPLSFGQNPLQFQPMPGFDVGQTKPYIAEGISKAFEGITGGITAQYKRQDALKELAIKQAQFDRQQTDKEADEKLRRDNEKIRAEAEKIRAETADRVKGVASGEDIVSKILSVEPKATSTTAPSSILAAPDSPVKLDTPGLLAARNGVLQREAQRNVEATGAPVAGDPSNIDYGPLSGPAPQQGALQLGVGPVPASQVSLFGNIGAPPAAPSIQLAAPSGAGAFAPMQPIGMPQEPLRLPSQPSPVTVGQLVGAPPATGGAPVDFTDPVGRPEGKEMAQYYWIPDSPLGSAATQAAVQKFIKDFNTSGNTELKAIGAEHEKGGFKIKYANKEEEKRKADEGEHARSAVESAKVARLRNTEGAAITSAPQVKLHESNNGPRRQMQAFVASYESSRDFPKSAGAADIDMINSYIRATSGGKVTENEVHLLKDAKSWADKFMYTLDKPQTGAALTQSQRDQMLRTMAHITNMSAASANDVLSVGRERMIKGGEKDESYLPQMYVNNLVPKADVPFLMGKFKKSIQELDTRRVQASKAGNKKQEQLISSQIKQLLDQQEDLAKRFDEENGITSSPLLGGHDFEHKRQGYVGGGGYLMGMPSASESGNANIREANE